MKYVVDTCIFNKLLDDLIEKKNLPDDGEFIASHIQMDEIMNTCDKKRRERLLNIFKETISEVVPTETMILDVSRLGACKLGDGTIYNTIKDTLDRQNNRKANNIMDALIAEVAVENGYTLITADYHLSKVAKTHGCNVCYYKT